MITAVRTDRAVIYIVREDRGDGTCGIYREGRELIGTFPNRRAADRAWRRLRRLAHTRLRQARLTMETA
jgi:hypothetical protein